MNLEFQDLFQKKLSSLFDVICYLFKREAEIEFAGKDDCSSIHRIISVATSLQKCEIASHPGIFTGRSS